MREVARRLLLDPVSHLIAWGVGVLYVFLFLVAMGDLTIDAATRPAGLFVVPDWQSLLTRVRGPFQFEGIAVVEAPFLVWIVSPVNVAIGMVLGLLTGVQIAVVRIARRCSVACGLSPATGILAALPGLLAGSACCAPILAILLGIQITAAFVTMIGLMVPLAFGLLVAGLILTVSVAARRCQDVTGSHA